MLLDHCRRRRYNQRVKMQVSSINLTEVRLSQAALFGRAVLRLNASYESELVCFQCIDTSGKPKELFFLQI